MTRAIRNILLVLALCLPVSVVSTSLASPASAACKHSVGGSMRWDSGKVWTYGTARTCKNTKWTKVCARLWYHTLYFSRPEKTKCASLNSLHSVGLATPKNACWAGHWQANVYVYAGSKVVDSEWSRQLSSGGGCSGSGTSPVTD